MAEKDNNIIILALGIVGVALGFFAYLIYVQNRDKLQLSQLYNIPNQHPDFRSLLENQEHMIKNQQEQINGIYKLVNTVNPSPTPNKPKDNAPVAASVMNLKTTPLDKIRQNKFGLL